MLTGIIIAKKGEKKIKKCIDALGFCDEVLVVYNNGEAGLDFSAVRNKALQDAKHEWVLYIDTDEVISSKLEKEILSTVKIPLFDAYKIKRQDEFWGKPVLYGEVYSARTKGIIRLIRKGSGKWEGRVHEVFVSQGTVGKLDEPLLHYPHESITGFLEKINYYSTLRTNELYRKGIRTNIFEIIAMPTGKFLYSFFILMGFRDGARGFVYSFMMLFHSFLVRSKLFLLQDKN